MTGNRVTLISDCLAWVRIRDYVSFAELEDWLARRGIPVKGEYSLDAGQHPNVVFWAGVSEEFCDIVRELKPHLDLEPCSPMSATLIYLVDGKALNLPFAKRPPANGYRDPHWLPVTLRTKQRATPAEIRAAREQALRKLGDVMT
jgi:hypothetical protein